MTRVVLLSLYGFRMCPDCPHCALSDSPCMDMFGSNATPMGGSAGRCDGMVAAVEAQKAEGVLHIHAFLYLQMVCQFKTLSQLGQMLRDKLITADAMKEYISYTRCASYPDVSKFHTDQSTIEKEWPAFAKDLSLSRLPAFFWNEKDAQGGTW